MDSFDQLLSIPRISKDTNFWMVRAKRGFFFDEFLRKEYIAIGWNSISKSMISDRLTRSREKHAESFHQRNIRRKQAGNCAQ